MEEAIERKLHSSTPKNKKLATMDDGRNRWEWFGHRQNFSPERGGEREKREP